MNFGAPAMTGSSRPPNRTCTAACFTPARSKHVPQTHPGPEARCSSSRSPIARPERAVHVNARVSRRTSLTAASSTRGKTIEDEVVQRQRQRLIDLPAHRQAKLVNIDLTREIRPVPAHIVLVIRREDAPVKILKRGFEPRWTRPLPGSSVLLRVSRRNRPRTGTRPAPAGRKPTFAPRPAQTAMPSRPCLPAPSKRRRVNR